jgi:hypothetical protein
MKGMHHSQADRRPLPIPASSPAVLAGFVFGVLATVAAWYVARRVMGDRSHLGPRRMDDLIVNRRYELPSSRTRSNGDEPWEHHNEVLG